MEWWSIGAMPPNTSLLQYLTTPSLHDSTSPSPHHSPIPSFHSSMFGFVPADGLAQKLRRAREAQLLLHSRAIGLDGLHTHSQRLRDLACAETLAQHLKHFQFAVTELLDRRSAGRRLVFHQPGGHRLRPAFTEVKFA